MPLYKKKNKLSCDNYRGVSLLSHCGKVMTSIMLQRIRQRTEEILSEAQAGFRAGRCTIDQLFTLRRIAECTGTLNSASICIAFGSVWRIGLWRVMRFLSYEEKSVRLIIIIIIIHSFYRAMCQQIQLKIAGVESQARVVAGYWL